MIIDSQIGRLALLLWMAIQLSFGQTTAVENGKQAFDAGRYAEALRWFEKAAPDPASCELFLYRGLAQYRLSRIETAIVDFRSAAECDPKLTEAHLALAESYSQKGDDNRALMAYETILKSRPDDVRALRGAAPLYLRHQLNDRAAPVLERLVQLQPGDAQARSDLGAVYAATGKLALAEQEFSAALQLDHGHPSALIGLGNVYLKTQRAAAALDLLNRAAKASPGSFEPLFLLGSAYNSLGRYQDAIRSLEAARRLAGNELEVYYQLAQAYGHLGRIQDRKLALASFTELKEKHERVIQTQREAARLLGEAKPFVDAGDLKHATELLEEARKLDPRNDQILFRLAGLRYDRKEYGAARDSIREAIASAPSEWLYHYLLGLIEKDSHTPAAARASFEAAIRLNSRAAEAYNQLGDLEMRDNEPGRAIPYFRRALEINPTERAYELNLQAASRAAGHN